MELSGNRGLSRIVFPLVYLTLLFVFFGIFTMNTHAAEGNDVRNPRFSPDGKSLIFDRCDPDYPDRCRIHVHNLETGTLEYYLPPSGQTWMQANYSDSSDKLVFVTSPAGDRNRDAFSQRHEIYGKTQIAIMGLDGSNMRVVTSLPGYKGMPAFSHSGKKVIFAQAEQIRDSGKTVAAFWDLWELNLETGVTSYFAGRFKFFQMSQSTYFPDDQRVLMNGDVPMAESLVGPSGILAKSHREFSSRYNSNYVFVVNRGQGVLESPLFTELASVSESSLDARGNVFFMADGGPKEGIRVRRVGLDGSRQSWNYPPAASSMWGSSISSNGRHFIVSTTREGAPSRDRKLMLLDTVSGMWREVVLPRETKQINH